MATELDQVNQTLALSGVPLAQLGTLAPQVQKNANAMRAQQNVNNFEDLLGRSEGTLDNKYGIKNAYAVGFGGSEIKDFSKHPGTRKNFNELNPDGSVGKVNSTTAAGKVQWLLKTWNNTSKITGVKDFSPESQRINYVQLLRDNKVLEAVQNGDFTTAIDVLGKRKQFTSLPTSTANQPKRSPEEFAKLAKASGIDLGALVTGKQQPLTNSQIIDGFIPTPQQRKAESQQTEAQAAAQQQQQALEEEAIAQQQQAAIAKEEQQAVALNKKIKIDSIGALLYEDTIGTIGKVAPTSTPYDNQLLSLIRAA